MSFTFEPTPPILSRDATPVAVFRYDPEVTDPKKKYLLLPNVQILSVQKREGDHVPVARFRYVLDDLAKALGFPTEFNELWPLASKHRYIVRNDDRLVVMIANPKGKKRIIFDGFAQIPQFDVGPDEASVTFMASSVFIRCYDATMMRRRQRHGDALASEGCADISRPIRFNPDGKKNCIKDDYREEGSDPEKAYPIFVDDGQVKDLEKVDFWTLSRFARHLLKVFNSEEKYVENPTLSVLDSLLKSRAPKEGSDFFDPKDPSSFTENDPTLEDYDATNKHWPDVLGEVLGFHGYGMQVVTEDDGADPPEPWTYLEVYRKGLDGPTEPKEIFLPARVGDALDPAKANLWSIHLARDANAMANEVLIETAPKLYEVSIILAPGFTPASGDETASGRKTFQKASLIGGSATNQNKYRVWIADECGEGHWDKASSTFVTTAFDFSDLWPNKAQSGNLPATKTYAVRRRKPRAKLLTKDDKKKPRKAELAFSRDYGGPSPALWDGSGTWQPIASGWSLLDDRIGIMVDAENPEAWKIGNFPGATKQQHGPVLKAITAMANPTGGNTYFFLRLTAVIEADSGMEITAKKRAASPSKFTYQKRIDAKDHYKYGVIIDKSAYNTTGKEILSLDPTTAAMAKAQAIQRAHEVPPLAGSYAVPGISTYYTIGDRISRISGQAVSFRANAGAGQKEGPSYPFIVGVTWEFSPDQKTTLLLSDRRAEPQRV